MEETVLVQCKVNYMSEDSQIKSIVEQVNDINRRIQNNYLLIFLAPFMAIVNYNIKISSDVLLLGTIINTIILILCVRKHGILIKQKELLLLKTWHSFFKKYPDLIYERVYLSLKDLDSKIIFEILKDRDLRYKCTYYISKIEESDTDDNLSSSWAFYDKVILQEFAQIINS